MVHTPRTWLVSLGSTFFLLSTTPASAAYNDARAASGARVWVDIKTPGEAFAYTSSRGDKWQLVMSDEFNTPRRTFLPGDDHLWTAFEGPDGVNAGLSYYSNALATTECQPDDPTVCYLKLRATNVPRTTSVWVQEASPPGMKSITMFYQSAMVQSWNKFCFQGGMVEVRAKLPGAVGAQSKNPDLAGGALSRVKSPAFYPTWPGIWMMGNLGRALFRESTNRMWPFSYDKCEPDAFEPTNQRISACDKNPGSGMNPSQGRGAPEIDILEGGGLEISSSLQIGPGMPTDFRRIAGETSDCFFKSACQTVGANAVGVPTATYAARGHKSWYQGLRYAFNPFCAKNATQGTQTLATIEASLKAGITENKCTLATCPASLDVNSNLTAIEGTTTKTNNTNWGINTDGSCFAQMNSYDGALLCSPGNADPECVKQVEKAGGGQTPVQAASAQPYKYTLDAVSANWPIHLAMYTDFLAYQVEWVPGKDGYIRWMLERQPLFEIPAAAITTPPQGSTTKNPSKILPEEPMYIIMNVALSSSWSAEPPNAPRACKDHGSITDTNTIGLSELICDQFPLDMKIDYVRVYQDMSSSSKMSVGCDPASHPTRQWIKDHIKEYQDAANPVVEVAGKATCMDNSDCSETGVGSGSCRNGRCVCSSKEWTGPRCTTQRTDDFGLSASSTSGDQPPPPADDGMGYWPGNGKAEPAFGTNKLGQVFGIGAGALVGLVIVLYIAKKVRIWFYYRSQPEIDHNIVHPEGAEAPVSEFVRSTQGRLTGTGPVSAQKPGALPR